MSIKEMKNVIHKNKNAPLLSSIHSGVLLLQLYLVRYEQYHMGAEITESFD